MLKRVVLGVAVVLLAPCARAQQTAPAASYDKPLAWRYQSEQEWIVSDIASSIAARADRLRSVPIGVVKVSTAEPAGGIARFAVEAGGVRTIVEIRDHIWAPANYSALATLWTAGIRRSLPAEPESDLLSALTTPRIDVLEAANRQIGSRLSRAAAGRAAWDDAALLAGVMALREGIEFGDVRPFLSKMAADLAVADASGSAPTPSGRVAGVIQLTLTGRQRDAVDRLQKWEASSPSPLERSWIRALRIRATGDWRLLDRPKTATLLERIEYARALVTRRGQTALLDFLDESHPEDVADWTRIAEGRDPTVEISNRFDEEAVRDEINDAAFVWKRVSHRSPDARIELSALVDALNDDPTAEKSLAIDWPTWAASFERHLARHIVAMVHRESWTFGRPSEARTEATRLEQAFGRLSVFPIAKLRYALDDGQYADAMKSVIGMMLRRPELLTPAMWRMGLEPRNGRLPSGVTPQSVWFTTLVPAGTAQDAEERVYLYRRTNHLTLPALHDVRLLAPYSRYLLEEEMRWRYRSPAVPPLADYRREAGSLAEYDADVLGDLLNAAKTDPAAYVPLGERLCELQVSRCETLALYLADHDRNEEAARTFQRWIDTDRDTVGVANGSLWLIMYYDEHGEGARALGLANRAATTFSFRGLTAKARLLERMGNYVEAEAIHKQASERYNRTSALAAFYARWSKVSGDPGVKNAGDTLMAAVFPRGLERFAAPAPSGAPRDGVRITDAGATGAKAGFDIGDIVVAVDGIAVHNYDQFLMARQLDTKPDIEFTIWKNGNYVAVSGRLRDRWISGAFVTYRAPSTQ